MKHPTLYGFSIIAYGLIMGNIIFLTKVLNINNKKKLAYLIIYIVFTVLFGNAINFIYFSMVCEINGEGLLYMLRVNHFIFSICADRACPTGLMNQQASCLLCVQVCALSKRQLNIETFIY